ncbi:Uncharacterised protein [Achromobacter xylosoxidans]|nr:Uncharacterised protein [Achromobacter xylosoxidans]
MTLARLPATSNMPIKRDGLFAVTWFRMVAARWLPSIGLPATWPASCVWLAAPLLFSTTPEGPTLNWVKRLFETPPAEGGAILTTGTPLAVPTTGRWPATFLSTEMGSVCASTGVQTCVYSTNQTTTERSLDMARRLSVSVKQQIERRTGPRARPV